MTKLTKNKALIEFLRHARKIGNSIVKVIKSNRPREKLLYPIHYGDKNATICFAVESTSDKSDVIKLRKSYNKMDFLVVTKNFINDNSFKKNKIDCKGYQEIVDRNIDIVVLLNHESELEVMQNCTSLFGETGHLFSIYDEQRYWLEGWEEVHHATVHYRGLDLDVMPSGGVLPPSYWANWSYINYLIQKFSLTDAKILDMFAGSGCIGFSLKNETPCQSVAFADANYLACESMRTTIANNPTLESEVWLTDVFDNIPPEKKFDLIVGNPPHFARPFYSMRTLTGSDVDWKAHKKLFETIESRLTEKGKVCFMEALGKDSDRIPTLEAPTGSYKAFYQKLEEICPSLKIENVIEINKGWHYAITIGRK